MTPDLLSPEVPTPPSPVVDQLGEAVRKKAEEDTREPLALIASLQENLSLYSQSVQKHAEESAIAAMMQAVGFPAPPVRDLGPLQGVLRTNLTALLNLIKAEEGTTSGPYEGGEPGFLAFPPGQRVWPTPASDISEEEEENVARVLASADTLSGHGWCQIPAQKLKFLIQLYVAEIREIQDRIPATSHHYWKLGQAVKMLSAIKYDSAIPGFIKGLSLDHREDWVKIQEDTWRLLNAYEKLTPDTIVAPEYPATKKPKDREESLTWPDLPNIREIAKDKPIALIGGLAVAPKIAAIRAKFGVNVEWVEIYRDKGDALAVAKTKAGAFSAVILLEKFLGHKSSGAIIAACRAQGILWAYGGNAGTATLLRALQQIDTKTAVA